jgi:cytidine deaminase
MKREEWKIEYSVYRESVPVEYEALCRAARDAVGGAYSVYSHFSVGAAVLLNNGAMVCGANQENAAYPSGLCAERVALFQACSAFPEVGVKAVAVAARQEGNEVEEPVTPCGACRQVMSEIIHRYGNDFDVLLLGKTRTIVVKASALLPFAFVIP